MSDTLIEKNAKPMIRPVAIAMNPKEANEAEGVTIRRTIGSEQMVVLDPFLLLDHLYVAPTGEAKSVGFPRHPHRGIETLTYVFTGSVRHKDSLGNDDGISDGGAQWMTAGSGIFHEEMLQSGANGNEGLQIWFNLPAAAKFIPPAYYPATGSDVPTITTESGAKVSVVAGNFDGIEGPFAGIAVKPTYLHIALPKGASIALPAPVSETTIAYVYRGTMTFGNAENPKEINAPQLAVFGEGDTVHASAATDDAAFVFVSARPNNEPIVQYRSLVLNTITQMQQALTDIEQGTFVKGK